MMSESSPLHYEPALDGLELDGAALLDDAARMLRYFVVFPSGEAADAAVLFAAATHAQHKLQVAPRFYVRSPVKRCGKSRLLTVMRGLVRKPLSTANISAAALVRSITEDDPPTIVADECDATFGKALRNDERAEHLRGILNAGFDRGWPYVRWDVTTRQTEECPTFAMALLAGIGDLPDTVADRAVTVTLRRRAPGEHVHKYRTRRHKDRITALGVRLGEWITMNADKLADAEPDMPEGLSDRAEDVWEPLLAVADLAGGDWPDRARQAAKALSAEADAGAADESLSMRLLADLAVVFGDHDKLPTSAILDRLHGLDESPWNSLGKPPRPLDANGLADRLRLFGVSPTAIRLGASTPRGYYRANLADAWTRYLPRNGGRNSRNAATSQVTELGGATGGATGATPHGRTVAPVAPAVAGAARSDQGRCGVASVASPICAVCHKPMDPVLAEAGFSTHPACDPAEVPQEPPGSESGELSPGVPDDW
jgi:hypothetical protein